MLPFAHVKFVLLIAVPDDDVRCRSQKLEAMIDIFISNLYDVSSICTPGPGAIGRNLAEQIGHGVRRLMKSLFL